MSDKKISPIKRWELTTKLYQHFWNRWNKEYLNTLQQRPKKYQTVSHQPKINDVVLLKEDNTPPTFWNIGRIMQIHPGTDNIVRVVTVKAKNAIFKRPVSKISVLPIEQN